MNKYLDMSIVEINSKLKNKELRPIDLIEECFDRIEQSSDLNAFITLNKDEARRQAYELENKEVDNLLFGIPIAIKDNIITKGLRTTCASKMLGEFIPIYDATVIEKIKDKNMIIIGKTNMDEFAMGSTSQTSHFKAPKNPWNKDMVTGGSSGGSAAVIAGNIVPCALGSDTGGSIRQPASYCGIVGMKPTYGRVSRYGLVAFGSSLDQIGPMTKSVLENALLLNILVGHDEKDLTSINCEPEDFTRDIGKDIKGMKFAVPNYFLSDIVSHEVKVEIEKSIKLLELAGATVDRIDIDYLENAVTLYQIIAMGEASSNLARFDGVRFGYSCESPSSIEELYCKTRAEGFGKEVKRRIMVGSYILSGDNAATYYTKALQIRDAMKKSFQKAFETYDCILGPTATTPAYALGENLDDPRKTFLDDILVIPVNMAGLPAVNIPVGFSENNLPIGLHIIGSYFDEAKIYRVASYIESHQNKNFCLKGVVKDESI